MQNAMLSVQDKTLYGYDLYRNGLRLMNKNGFQTGKLEREEKKQRKH